MLKAGHFSQNPRQASNLDSQASFRRQRTWRNGYFPTAAVCRHAGFSRQRLWGFAVNFEYLAANRHSKAEENKIDQLKCNLEYFFKFQIFIEAQTRAVSSWSWQLLGNAMYFTDRYTDYILQEITHGALWLKCTGFYARLYYFYREVLLFVYSLLKQWKQIE